MYNISSFKCLGVYESFYIFAIQPRNFGVHILESVFALSLTENVEVFKKNGGERTTLTSCLDI